jgi:hypothetical protein
MTIASLIVDVAANTVQLVKDMEGIRGQFDKLGSMATKLAGVLVGAFTIRAITNLAGQLIEFAAGMENMQARTGMGVIALQEFNFAGKAAGVSLDTIASASANLQRNLADGDTSTVGALKLLKLGFTEFKALKPEDQIAQLASRMKEIPNPADRIRLAFETMGKAGVEALPFLITNLDELRQKAHELGVVLDESAIKQLEGLGNALDVLSLVGRAALAKALIPMVPALTDLAGAVQYLPKLLDAVVLGFDAVVFYGAKVVKVSADIMIAMLKTQQFLSPFKGLDAELQAGIDAFTRLSEGATAVATAVVEVDRSHKAATASTREHAAAVPSLTFNYGAASDAAKALEIQIAKVAKAEHDLFFDMRMFGAKQIEELTKVVQTEVARQPDAVRDAQLDIVAIISGQQAQLAALHGQALTGTDAMTAALNAKHAAALAHIAQLGRTATAEGIGGPAWAAQAQIAADNANAIFVNEFDQITEEINKTFRTDIPAALATVPPAAGAAASSITESFSLAFAHIGNDAESAAARVIAALHLAETNMHNSQFFGPNFGTADSINSMAQRSAGLTLPSFASGGEGDFGSGTPVMLHGRERIIPLDRSGAGGGTTVYATVSITGQGAQAGREASDALAKRMKDLGVRI